MTTLTNQFLIAMPDMDNPSFSHTVSYICEHDEEGAMGIVINRSIGITIGELFEQVNIDHKPGFRHNTRNVLFGGPVERERGFVLHTGSSEWNASMPISDNVSITTSVDILHAIGHGKGPDSFLLALGYAGWGAGQLENEILENTWLSSPADTRILFNADGDPAWYQAAQLIGVDIKHLQCQAGHA